MFSSLWIVAIVLFVGTWILYYLEDGRSHGSALEYRHKYERLVSRLEALVGTANGLEARAKAAGEVRILDSYLSHLKMLETLMQAVLKMPSYSTQVATLKAPMFLVDDMTMRFQRISEDVSASFGGRRKSPRAEVAPQLGCYFCSRPFEAFSFHKVRVKVEGTSQDVAACKICNAKLLSGKKAKVLFFSEGEKTVHWSKAKDYTPTAQFWGINDDSVPPPGASAKSHLTLVYSNVTPLSFVSRLE